MPKRSRKDMKELFQDYLTKLKCIEGKFCLLEFGPHKLPVHVQDIVLARQADIINLPDKRVDEDGTYYTPMSMCIQCKEGKLPVVLEDINAVVLTTRSVCVILDNTQIRFTLGDTSEGCTNGS